MTILAVDTAGERLLACRLSNGKPRSLALKAAARQDQLLERALGRLFPGGKLPIDAIAVGTGPGRFTGIRIGVAFAVMLGRTLGVPVAGFRGLESLAYQESWKKGARFPILVCATLHAIRDEVFWGLYRVSGPGQVEAVSQDKWGPRAAMEKEAADAKAKLVSGPLSAETLARRAELSLREGGKPPAPEPYYLKPGNYERPAGGR